MHNPGASRRGNVKVCLAVESLFRWRSQRRFRDRSRRGCLTFPGAKRRSRSRTMESSRSRSARWRDPFAIPGNGSPRCRKYAVRIAARPGTAVRSRDTNICAFAMRSARAAVLPPGAKEIVMAKGQMRSNKEKKKPKADKNIKKGGAAPSPFSSGKTPAGQSPNSKKN
jgi:hypothetical protein